MIGSYLSEMLVWTGEATGLRSQSWQAHGTSVHGPSDFADEQANEAGGPPTKAGGPGGGAGGQAIEFDGSPAAPLVPPWPTPPLESLPPAGVFSPGFRARAPHAATSTQKSAAHVADRGRLGRTCIMLE